MPLEQRIRKNAKTEKRYWEIGKVGPFESCYITAKARGYQVIRLTPRGIRLHILNSSSYATITEEDRSGKHWMLVFYNYYPSDQEPLSK